MEYIVKLKKIISVKDNTSTVSVEYNGREQIMTMDRDKCSVGSEYAIVKDIHGTISAHKITEVEFVVTGKVRRDTETNYSTAAIEIQKSCDEEFVPTNTPYMAGYFPIIREEDKFLAKGYWESKDRGMVFVSLSQERIMSSGQTAVKNFLLGAVPGLGEMLALRIIEKFGLHAIDEIKKAPTKLSSIVGIGPVLVAKIYDGITRTSILEDMFFFLSRHDIPSHKILKIYKKCTVSAMRRLRENPYSFIEFNKSLLTFREADKIAKSCGIAADSNLRIQALIICFLEKECSDRGDLFTYKERLCQQINDFANKTAYKKLSFTIEERHLNEALDTLVETKRIFIQPHPTGICIYHSYYKYVEDMVISKLKMLLSNTILPMGTHSEINDAVTAYESATGFSLAPRQKEAIFMALQNGISILTGGPGTGKTQTTNAIISAIRSIKPTASIDLCAPTGKASKRLSELTSMPAFTIHKRLRCIPFSSDDDLEPIESDFLIVDESSMVDAVLFFKLLKNISDHTRILFVGDHNQLAPVGVGLILRDMISSKKIPVTELDEIFRQSKTSQIVTVSHAISKGLTFESGLKIDGRRGDLKFFVKKTTEEITEAIFLSIEKAIAGGIALSDIQILTPMNVTEIGTKVLNRRIQDKFNPSTPGKNEYVVNASMVLRVGDRVMQTRNNYDIDVFNGSVGYVTNIYKMARETYVVVDFDGVEVEYDSKIIPELILSYAITIHRSQGSEFPFVIVPISPRHKIMMNRNLIYTAITRAKKYVRIIGCDKCFNEGILSIENVTRNSHIKERIIAEC